MTEQQKKIVDIVNKLEDWGIFPLGIGAWAIQRTPSGRGQLVYCSKGIKKDGTTYKPVVFGSSKVLTGVAEGLTDKRLFGLAVDLDKINGKNVKAVPLNTETFF